MERVYAVGNIKASSYKALLFEFEGKEHWLPKSQIDLLRKPGTVFTYMVSMPEWLANKNNIVCMNASEFESVTGEWITNLENTYQGKIGDSNINLRNKFIKLYSGTEDGLQGCVKCCSELPKFFVMEGAKKEKNKFRSMLVCTICKNRATLDLTEEVKFTDLIDKWNQSALSMRNDKIKLK